MKIIVSENQLEAVLRDSDVINEQMGNDQASVVILQNKINDIIDKQQKELLDQISIEMVLNKGIVSIKIGDKTYPMETKVRGVYATVIPPKSVISFNGPPMSSLFQEIEKLPEYKSLAEKHPEIKGQIEKSSILGKIYTDLQNQGMFKLTVTRKLPDPKDEKYAVDFGTPYPLGEFFERNKVVYRFKNGSFGTLESGALQMDLSSIKLTLDETAPQKSVPAMPQSITVRTLVLQDLFNFNDAEFKNPQQVDQQLASYVQEIKGYIQKFGQPFIDAYKAGNPTVFGYSSVDGDPNQKITGEYKPCAGSGTRKQYDICLSQERSRKIAEELNRLLPELGGAIKFKGMGETTKWGPGWTAQNPTIPEQTAPNRRYLLPSIIVQASPQQPVAQK